MVDAYVIMLIVTLEYNCNLTTPIDTCIFVNDNHEVCLSVCLLNELALYVYMYYGCVSVAGCVVVVSLTLNHGCV